MTVRAAIVGLGRWGQRLVSSVEGSDKIRIVAGVTRRLERAQGFADARGFPLGADYDAVLRDPAIDAVVLATPHSLHADQVMAAAAAGKQIFCDKPFTLDKASAERAVAAAEAAGVTLAVGFNRRFLPAFRQVARLIADGTFGTVLHAEANFSVNAVGRYDDDSWRLDRSEAPGGGLTGLGIHLIDAMIDLMGPIDSVFAQSTGRVLSEIDDTTSVLFRFRSGASANLTTLLATPTFFRFHLFGSAAHVELRGPDRLELTRLADTVATVTDHPPIDLERAELEAFADAVAGRAAFPVRGADAIHGAAAFEAIIRSAATGQPVPVA
ncbi:MAG TPA: Gfo/Idh/MocA family oxidoreductase [Aliidongia sp.]|uniref:Gfo/Idh/MocA family protein n=1 Tax=Aliidongia sp. TaxID=1914230 RepID=UPI002DDCE987|nr:Gfo/Idh/MocA family oxidoreductase [Aliidongia sp.]HEV2673570.1 Gfo/Idh/MocA family oxidoreductase [Aliidongia sp.]